MRKMRNIFLFLAVSFILLFSISFVVAETCETTGEVSNGKYCDVDGILQNLKANGISCLNDYECLDNSCVEGICQSKYATILENQNALQEILNMLNGIECTPGETSCDGKIYLMCGAKGVWESKGNVDGKCGYSSGGGGGGGGSSISIIISSPKNITYSANQILLQVKDSNNNANYWKYSLNGGTKTSFKSGDYITAKQGSNYLTFFASKTATSSETSKTIVFSVAVSSAAPFCGDRVCDSDEDCADCSKDCGKCDEPIYLGECGDGTCDADESSYTCPEDCEAKTPTSYWVIVIVIILLIIGIIIFLLRHKLKKIDFFQKLFPHSHPN